MDFEKRLKETALKENIEYINVISKDAEGYNSVIAGLIPYYAGDEKSYFSKYTRGKDYHKVGREIFEKILSELGVKDFKIYVDVSPYNEREIAIRAGLGVMGENGLLINEKYGSFVFIAIAFLNLSEKYEEYSYKSCISCGRCRKGCPVGAIGEDKICYEKCISHITQKKNITEAEEKIIAENNSAWGCDICQEVCPYNKEPEITPISEFKERLLFEMNDLDHLSNREFKEKYGYYALAYKGKNIIKRNINLIKK